MSLARRRACVSPQRGDNPCRDPVRTRAVLAVAILSTLGLTACSQSTPLYRDPSAPVDRRVADVLGRMTLEEKAAQLLAIWQQKRQIVDAAGNFDPTKAAPVLGRGVGQVTRPSDGLERGDKPRSPREMVEFVNAIQKWALDNTRLAIPVMFHEEALHGLAAP